MPGQLVPYVPAGGRVSLRGGAWEAEVRRLTRDAVMLHASEQVTLFRGPAIPGGTVAVSGFSRTKNKNVVAARAWDPAVYPDPGPGGWEPVRVGQPKYLLAALSGGQWVDDYYTATFEGYMAALTDPDTTDTSSGTTRRLTLWGGLVEANGEVWRPIL